MHASSRAQKIHRRCELLVALLILVGVTIALSPADGAAAAETDIEPAPPGEATPAPIAGAQEQPVGTAPADEGAAGEPAPEDPATQPEPPPPEAGSPEEVDSSPEPARERGSRRLRINGARLSTDRIFLGSRNRVAFSFRLSGRQGRRLLVKVVKVSTGSVKKRFRLGRVGPGSRQRVAWDGQRGGRGGFVDQGEYAFRVFAGGERAKVSRGSEGQRFRFYEHRFPLLGRHTYGDGFGAGRGHQGQDLFAACGTRIVAARGGRVQTKAYHSAAGYYVVIDGRGTGQDYAYMHLEKGDRPPEGSWVATGELIGRESDTGNADGCHLHFELWTSPGWYEGGHAKPPTRALQRWDRWS